MAWLYVLLAFQVLILLIPWRLAFLYWRVAGADHLILQLGIGSWPGISFKILQLDQDDDDPPSPFFWWKMFRGGMRLVGALSRPWGRFFLFLLGGRGRTLPTILYNVFRRLAGLCSALQIEGSLGTGDAALTAMAIGGLWSAFGFIHPLLSPNHCRPQIRMRPDYGADGLVLRLRCIFHLQMGHIILAGGRHLLRLGRWKGANQHG
ncbi:MAG: DUF2953 domain-containing protein [Limnochordia bacterium]|jgi:hypothetical protein